MQMKENSDCLTFLLNRSLLSLPFFLVWAQIHDLGHTRREMRSTTIKLHHQLQVLDFLKYFIFCVVQL